MTVHSMLENCDTICFVYRPSVLHICSQISTDERTTALSQILPCSSCYFSSPAKPPVRDTLSKLWPKNGPHSLPTTHRSLNVELVSVPKTKFAVPLDRDSVGTRCSTGISCFPPGGEWRCRRKCVVNGNHPYTAFVPRRAWHWWRRDGPPSTTGTPSAYTYVSRIAKWMVGRCDVMLCREYRSRYPGVASVEALKDDRQVYASTIPTVVAVVPSARWIQLLDDGAVGTVKSGGI